MGEKMELVDVTGPITKGPTGRVNRRTGDPILRKCTPYWVVRVVAYTGTSVIVRDLRRGSEAEARRLADSLPRYVG